MIYLEEEFWYVKRGHGDQSIFYMEEFWSVTGSLRILLKGCQTEHLVISWISYISIAKQRPYYAIKWSHIRLVWQLVLKTTEVSKLLCKKQKCPDSSLAIIISTGSGCTSIKTLIHH